MAGWVYVRHLDFEEMMELPAWLVQGFQTCESELPVINSELSEKK